MGQAMTSEEIGLARNPTKPQPPFLSSPNCPFPNFNSPSIHSFDHDCRCLDVALMFAMLFLLLVRGIEFSLARDV